MPVNIYVDSWYSVEYHMGDYNDANKRSHEIFRVNIDTNTL